MALGSAKEKLIYKDDAGANWIVTLATDDVLTNSNLEIYDPATPPDPVPSGRISPTRCRRVYAQGSVTVGDVTRVVHKRFICNLGDGSLYVNNSPQTISYLGTDNLTSTGRRGEKFTF